MNVHLTPRVKFLTITLHDFANDFEVHTLGGWTSFPSTSDQMLILQSASPGAATTIFEV